MPNNLAPIGVSTYARPEHLRQAIEALKNNHLASQSTLYVFSDAPRPGDEERVAAVRSYLRTIDGFREVNIVERTTNGRVENSRGGMNWLLDHFGKVIFLAEDVVTAPGFLTYINQALDMYEENKRIFSVSGYSPPIKILEDYRHDVYFLRRFNAWGFGTWKNRFDQVRYITPEEYERFVADKNQVRDFVNGGGADMLHMLHKDAYGEIDAGDVKAMYAQFLSNQYTVYPAHSLAQNIGFDSSGEHCGTEEKHDVDLWDKTSDFVFTSEIQPDERILKANQKFRAMPLMSRLVTVTKRLGIYRILKRIKETVHNLFDGHATNNL
ncbi:MAG: sugar transferase [Halobacteria archaeon]|nr:sugar transferase [Halobacteria archaeon]